MLQKTTIDAWIKRLMKSACQSDATKIATLRITIISQRNRRLLQRGVV
jgi:hypothetical protein